MHHCEGSYRKYNQCIDSASDPLHLLFVNTWDKIKWMNKSTKTPPGEGERRAIGGFYPQYRYSARIIYKHLREGTLEWIRVADPDAGRVDDCVICSANRVDGYQVKSWRRKGNFTFSSLVSQQNDAPPLINQLFEGWKTLSQLHPGCSVHVHLITNAHPSASMVSAEE